MKQQPSSKIKFSLVSKCGNWIKTAFAAVLAVGLMSGIARAEYASQALDNELVYLGLTGTSLAARVDAASQYTLKTAVSLAVAEFPMSAADIVKVACGAASDRFDATAVRSFHFSGVATLPAAYVYDIPVMVQGAIAGLKASQLLVATGTMQVLQSGSNYYTPSIVASISQAAAAVMAQRDATPPASGFSLRTTNIPTDVGSILTKAIQGSVTPASDAALIAGTTVSGLYTTGTGLGISGTAVDAQLGTIAGYAIKALPIASQPGVAYAVTTQVGLSLSGTAVADEIAYGIAATKGSPNTVLVSGSTLQVSNQIIQAIATNISVSGSTVLTTGTISTTVSSKVYFTRSVAVGNSLAAYGIANGVAASGLPTGMTADQFAGLVAKSGPGVGVTAATGLLDYVKNAFAAGIVAATDTGSVNAIAVIDAVKTQAAGTAAERTALVAAVAGAAASNTATITALANNYWNDQYISAGALQSTILNQRTTFAKGIAVAAISNPTAVQSAVDAVLSHLLTTSITEDGGLQTYASKIILGSLLSPSYAQAVTSAVIVSATGSKSGWATTLATMNVTAQSKAGVAAAGYLADPSLTGTVLSNYVQGIAGQINPSTLTVASDKSKALIAATVVGVGASPDQVLSSSGSTSLMSQLSGTSGAILGAFSGNIISSLTGVYATGSNIQAISYDVATVSGTLTGSDLEQYLGKLAFGNYNNSAAVQAATTGVIPLVTGTAADPLAMFVKNAAVTANVLGTAQVSITQAASNSLTGDPAKIAFGTDLSSYAAVTTPTAKLLGAVASTLTGTTTQAGTLAQQAVNSYTAGTMSGYLAGTFAAAVASNKPGNAADVALQVATNLPANLTSSVVLENLNKGAIAKAVAAATPDSAAAIAVAVAGAINKYSTASSTIAKEKANLVASVLSGVAGVTLTPLTAQQIQDIKDVVDNTAPKLGDHYAYSAYTVTATGTVITTGTYIVTGTTFNNDLANYVAKTAATTKSAAVSTDETLANANVTGAAVITAMQSYAGIVLVNLNLVAQGAAQQYMATSGTGAQATADYFATQVASQWNGAGSNVKKQNLAAGAALASPTEAPTIAHDIATYMTYGTTASIIANDRIGVATAVAGVLPNQASYIAEAVAPTLTGSNAAATATNLQNLVYKVIAGTWYKLPANTVADEMGAVVACTIDKALQVPGQTLTLAQLEGILSSGVKGKVSMSYDIIGAALSAIKTNDPSQYIQFKTDILTNTFWTNANIPALALLVPGNLQGNTITKLVQSAIDAIDGNNNKSDSFDAGHVTTPETGVTPG